MVPDTRQPARPERPAYLILSTPAQISVFRSILNACVATWADLDKDRLLLVHASGVTMHVVGRPFDSSIPSTEQVMLRDVLAECIPVSSAPPETPAFRWYEIVFDGEVLLDVMATSAEVALKEGRVNILEDRWKTRRAEDEARHMAANATARLAPEITWLYPQRLDVTRLPRKVWTDYPFVELRGKAKKVTRRIRCVEFLAFDGNKRATVRLSNKKVVTVNAAYLFNTARELE